MLLRIAVVGLLLVLGCRSATEVELLAIEEVAPAQLEPGGVLSLRGEGFAAGRACAVRLRGVTHRPGAAPLAVALSLAGEAETDERVVARLDAAAFAELGGHGTLQGEVTLSFEAPQGGRVTGRAPLALDLVQPMAHGAGHRQRLRQRAQALLSTVGLVLSPDSTTSQGLVVDWAADDSIAARAGLRKGDLIVRAAGIGLHSLGDFAPPPGLRALELEVMHSNGSRRTRRLPLHDHAARDLDRSLGRLSALGVAFLLCALFLSPLPSPRELLWGARARLRRAAPVAHGLWGAPRLRLSRWAALCGSVWGMLLLYADPGELLAVRSLSFYMAWAAANAALLLLGTGPLPARLRAAAGSLWPALGVLLVTGSACALGGTRSLSALMQAQGPWPWQWALFQQPALLAGFPLWLLCASRLGAGGTGGAGGGRVAALQRIAANVVLSALAAALLLGGDRWPPTPQLEPIPARLLGAALFVLKAWLVAGLLHLARRASLAPAPALALGSGVALIALSALWLWWQPPAAVAVAAGITLSSASALALLLALVAGPPREPALQLTQIPSPPAG